MFRLVWRTSRTVRLLGLQFLIPPTKRLSSHLCRLNTYLYSTRSGTVVSPASMGGSGSVIRPLSSQAQRQKCVLGLPEWATPPMVSTHSISTGIDGLFPVLTEIRMPAEEESVIPIRFKTVRWFARCRNLKTQRCLAPQIHFPSQSWKTLGKAASCERNLRSANGICTVMC